MEEIDTATLAIPQKYLKELALHPGSKVNSLTYLTLPNTSLDVPSLTDKTDLISGLYEGGLKLWDCSIDLVHLINQQPDIFRGKIVIELGCGQGLPGVMAMIQGAQEVCF